MKDPITKQRKQRLIHTSENQDYYIVSFEHKNEKDITEISEEAWISCLPNPLRSNANLQCYVPDNGYAEIRLFNILGTKQIVLHSGILEAGTHNFTFSVNCLDEKKLPCGTYILSMRSDNYQVQIKIIIL